MEQCILSVLKATQTIDSEIIVIDNDSADASADVVRQLYPNVILIQNEKNIGFSKANNQGAEIAQGEYLCILNPDIIVAEDTFVKMLEIADALPHQGILGPKLIDGTGNFLNESKRNIPSPLTSFRRLFGIRIGHVKDYYAMHISDIEVGDVDVLVGAFMMVTKKNYLAVEGFDEDYFMYGEDIDLSYKIKKKGLLNYYIGHASAVHYRGESTDRNATYVRRFYGAMRLFYKKHFKNNLFLDAMVAIAIKLVSFVQSFKNFDKEKRSIDIYYLVSKDEKLYREIVSKLGKKVKLIPSIDREYLGVQNIEFIFDNNFITFSEIINQMQKFKGNTVTFKIRPKGCNYFLGSDFSDGKGEVILI